MRIAKLCEVRVTGHGARGVGSPVLPPQARSAPVFPSSASDDDSKFARRKTFFVRGRDEHFFARFSERNCKSTRVYRRYGSAVCGVAVEVDFDGRYWSSVCEIWLGGADRGISCVRGTDAPARVTHSDRREPFRVHRFRWTLRGAQSCSIAQTVRVNGPVPGSQIGGGE